MTDRHTVSSLTFFDRKGWQVQFVEADLKIPLPRQFTPDATMQRPSLSQQGARKGFGARTRNQ